MEAHDKTMWATSEKGVAREGRLNKFRKSCGT
jgi:hypothetical protein